MDFEELQVIWDSQKEQPMYVFDHQAVLTSVQKRGRTIERMTSCFEIMMTLILLTMAVMFAGEPLFYHVDYHQLFAAILFLGAAVFIWMGRRHRQREELHFDQSLMGMIDKSLAQIEYKIQRLESVGWWFILPGCLGCLVSFIFLWSSKPAWIWPMTVLSMILGYWLVRREIWTSLLPQRHELETLRQKLLDGSSEESAQ